MLNLISNLVKSKHIFDVLWGKRMKASDLIRIKSDVIIFKGREDTQMNLVKKLRIKPRGFRARMTADEDSCFVGFGLFDGIRDVLYLYFINLLYIN